MERSEHLTFEKPQNKLGHEFVNSKQCHFTKVVYVVQHVIVHKKDRNYVPNQ